MKLLYIVVRHIFRYRITTINKNKEHTGIYFNTDLYYKHFIRNFVKIIESFFVKAEKLRTKVHYVNLEEIQTSVNKGHKVMILASHYSNWEWVGVNLPQVLDADCIAVYKPLSVSFMDKIVRKKRSRTGMKLAAMSEVVRYIHQYSSGSCFLFIADQSPALHQKDITVSFLGVPTSFFEGPAKLATKYNFQVYYQSVHEENGSYGVKFCKISATESITNTFAQYLEKDIRNNPYPWLWTHKRWKKNGVIY